VIVGAIKRNPTIPNTFDLNLGSGMNAQSPGAGCWTIGYIAVDNFYGPSIDPSLYGSTIDSFAYQGSGSWLVQPVPEPISEALFAFGLSTLGLFKLRRRVPQSIS
jgi:hypothetical protein